ncbi:MAG: hypothetical protein MPJ78_08840 [Hyphomicrobiaceae bacterium]|nr:hypothetical protein [Hyphomicrobiaceae bacterium]
MRKKIVELETFLNDLPEETAAKARAAAARIDELEHAAERIGSSDQRYLKMFAVAGVLALAATIFTLGGFIGFKSGEISLIGLTILAMAGAFPLLILIYSIRMRERTRIDKQKFEIIESHFLPYGAVYLPPGPERQTGVVAVSPSSHPWRKADVEKKKRAGWYW